MAILWAGVADRFRRLLSDRSGRAVIDLSILLWIVDVLRQAVLGMAVTSKRGPTVQLRLWTRGLRECKIQSGRRRRELQQAVSGKIVSLELGINSPNQDIPHGAQELGIYHL